jgi:hypothetical protein
MFWASISMSAHRDEKQEYVADVVLFVMFYENVADSSS